MNEYKKLNIKEWALEDRPREKLVLNGPRSLSDAELLAILISSGNLNESAVELTRRILTSVGNDLNELSRRSIDYLKGFNGIGDAKAIAIVAALELGKRRKEAGVFTTKRITGSRDAFDYFHPILGDLNHEEFWVMLLDRANKIKESFKASQGGVTGTVTDVKIIIKTALEKLACSIILCHNHPSGNLQASDADRQITRKISKAAKYMEIQVLDHIIIGQNSYLSFADEGML